MRSLLAALALLLLAACKPTPAPLNAPPAAVVTPLQRGINLGVWTAQTNLDALHASQVHPDDADLARIRQLGFAHVRVSFDPAWLADAALMLRPERLAEMQRDLSRLRSAGLFVVLTMQPESAFKQRLTQDPQHLRATARLWRELTKRLAAFTPREIAYELINEPEVSDAAKVREVLTVLAEGVRASAPQHTLVAQGPRC